MIHTYNLVKRKYVMSTCVSKLWFIIIFCIKTIGNVRSRFTCMAYLNDVEVEQGGATRFYSVVPSAGAAAFDLTPHADVQPKLGRIVIFDHQIFHEGIELHGDAKHILRTDVLFRLSSPSDYTSFTSDTSATVDVPEGMKTPDKKIRCTKN